MSIDKNDAYYVLKEQFIQNIDFSKDTRFNSKRAVYLQQHLNKALRQKELQN